MKVYETVKELAISIYEGYTDYILRVNKKSDRHLKWDVINKNQKIWEAFMRVNGVGRFVCVEPFGSLLFGVHRLL